MRVTHRRVTSFASIAVVLLVLSGCGATSDPPALTASTTSTAGVAPTTASPARPTGFVAFGDSGGGPMQDDVAAAMERWAAEHRVDALVTTGDNVYNHGEPDLFDDQLDVPYERLRERRPLWVTLGNHDVELGFGEEQLEYLGLPPLPYAKELPGVQFLFLDGNRLDASQMQWLDDRLAERGPPFRVVVLHQPPYACSQRGGVGYVEALLVAVAERHRVALVLSGHEHLYQRFTSPAGVTYVVTGGGGKSIYAYREACDVAPQLEAHAEVFHFVGAEVSDGRMTLTAVDTKGRVLDRFEIER